MELRFCFFVVVGSVCVVVVYVGSFCFFVLPLLGEARNGLQNTGDKRS